MPITDYSIHRTDRVPTLFECWAAIILAVLVGIIIGLSIKHGSDAYICPWWPEQGRQTGMSADRWR